MNKILKDTKELLGIPAEVTEFDVSLVMHVNSVLTTLNQIGVGEESYQTTIDSGDLTEFLPDNEDILSRVQMYIFMKVRLLFDPPTSSFVLTSLEKQLQEAEWRLMDAST